MYYIIKCIIIFTLLMCVEIISCEYCVCECSWPNEIIMSDEKYAVKFYPTGCINYCVPMNCTWKIINNFSDPNIYLSYYFYPVALRVNSTDVININSVYGDLVQSYTYDDNIGQTRQVDFTYKELSVNFDSDGIDAKYANDLIRTVGWNMYIFANYKSCDCSIPSSLYFYDPTNVYTIYSSINSQDGSSHYCVPISCNWNIVNMLENYDINVSGYINLRVDSLDCILATSIYGYPLLEKYWFDNTQNLQYTFYEKELAINFETDDQPDAGGSVFGAWEITLSLVPANTSSTNIISSTPSYNPTVMTACNCLTPKDMILNEENPSVSIQPYFRECTCDPNIYSWRVHNNFTLDNAYISVNIIYINLMLGHSDYLDLTLPDGKTLFRFNYNHNCKVTNKWYKCTAPIPYVINAPEFNIHFFTQINMQLLPLMELFEIRLEPAFQTCDCAKPNTIFMNKDDLVVNILPTDQSQKYNYYCVPMDCTWTVINGFYGRKTVQVIPNIMFMRKTAMDYIEGRSSDGSLLFHIDGLTPDHHYTTCKFHIDDYSFNITFHSDASVNTSYGFLPYWNLELKTSYDCVPTSLPALTFDTPAATTIITTHQPKSGSRQEIRLILMIALYIFYRIIKVY